MTTHAILTYGLSRSPTRALPEGPHQVVVLVAVHDAGEHGVEVRRRTDGQEEDEKEGLEVEEGRLLGDVSSVVVFEVGGTSRWEDGVKGGKGKEGGNGGDEGIRTMVRAVCE